MKSTHGSENLNAECKICIKQGGFVFEFATLSGYTVKTAAPKTEPPYKRSIDSLYAFFKRSLNRSLNLPREHLPQEAMRIRF